MSRQFPNFLDAYMDYAVDGFCPDAFHYWTGISVLAGALERKVWIPWSDSWHVYPNLYIFLVSTPGVGKSSAGTKGVTELLRHYEDITFIPSQVTEARLIELMTASRKTFPYGGGDKPHSSAYFYASEASNSLKPIYGDLKSCFTDWYDCGKIWDKGTQKDGELKIYNICFNMLAGCTFDYLGKLIPEEEIMGGFASRLLYVVHDGPVKRTPIWGSSAKVDQKLKGKLLDDLAIIHNLAGKFTASEEVKEKYVSWAIGNEKRLNNLTSEKMQAFLARKHVNIMKLAMIHSVSEGNTLRLEGRHWDQAQELVDSLESKFPKLINMASFSNKDSGGSIGGLVIEKIRSAGALGMDPGELKRALFLDGIESTKCDNTLAYMVKCGLMKIGLSGGGPRYQLTDNADINLSGLDGEDKKGLITEVKDSLHI